MSRINDIWQRKPAGLVLGLDFSGERVTSPTGHVGTLNNGASISGRTLVLDGVNDSLEFSDAPEFSFTSGGGVDLPFSVMGWVNLTSAADAFRTLVAKLTTTGGQLEWQLMVSNNSVSAKGVSLAMYTLNGAVAITRAQTVKSITAGTWFHTCGSYDASKTAGGIKMYINGVQVDDTSAGTSTYAGMSDGTAPLRIGLHTATSNPLAGSVAGIRIYSRVLAQPEIAQIYNAGAARIALGGTP